MLYEGNPNPEGNPFDLRVTLWTNNKLPVFQSKCLFPVYLEFCYRLIGIWDKLVYTIQGNAAGLVRV